MFDAIRPADAGLPADGPVSIAGYSRRSWCPAAAAELQPAYAPELDLRGVYAGATPADLAVAAKLDGHYAAGFLLLAVASMNYAYPELHLTDSLNAKGRQVARAVETECTVDGLVENAFTQTKDLTISGRPITSYLGEEPYASVVAEQRIGSRAPAVPALITHSAGDDIVPYAQGRAMARSWCELGATVQFDTLTVSTHVGGFVAASPDAFAWPEGRFDGAKAPTDCAEPVR